MDRVFLLRLSLARDTQESVVLLGFVGWQLRVPVPPIHLTSALSFSLRLSFFPSSTPSIYSNLAVLKQPAQPFPFYQKFCFIPLSPPSDTMASTRVLASRLASSMASTTTKVARPAMRVQVANASKRTITGKKSSGACRSTAVGPQRHRPEMVPSQLGLPVDPIEPVTTPP